MFFFIFCNFWDYVKLWHFCFFCQFPLWTRFGLGYFSRVPTTKIFFTFFLHLGYVSKPGKKNFYGRTNFEPKIQFWKKKILSKILGVGKDLKQNSYFYNKYDRKAMETEGYTNLVSVFQQPVYVLRREHVNTWRTIGLRNGREAVPETRIVSYVYNRRHRWRSSRRRR